MSKTITTIKHSLICTLILLAILALGAVVVMAKQANADDEFGVYHGYGYNQNNQNENLLITSISPSSANVGEGSKMVTIIGNGFTADSIARVDGSSRPTNFIDYSHLQVRLYSSDLNGASSRYINVFSPNSSGAYSNSVIFSINGYVAPITTNSGTSTAVRNGSTGGNSTSSNASNNSSGSVLGAQNTNQPTTSKNDNFSSLTSNALFGYNSFMPSGIIQWLLFAIFILLVVIIIRKIFFADKYHSTPLKHA